MNKTTIALIKKHVRCEPRNWHDTLGQVLWAYRYSPRGLTSTTPYKLVFGHDAVLPVEVNLQTIRMVKQCELLVEN